MREVSFDYTWLAKIVASNRTQMQKAIANNETVFICEVLPLVNTIDMAEWAHRSGIEISQAVWTECYNCDDWEKAEKTPTEKWENLRSMLIDNLHQQTPQGYFFYMGGTEYTYQPIKA